MDRSMLSLLGRDLLLTTWPIPRGIQKLHLGGRLRSRGAPHLAGISSSNPTKPPSIVLWM